jgi:hypothetical protein
MIIIHDPYWNTLAIYYVGEDGSTYVDRERPNGEWVDKTRTFDTQEKVRRYFPVSTIHEDDSDTILIEEES